jgi:hypothetical protein
MALVTEAFLNDLIDAPICLPATSMKADTWLVVSAIGISEVNPISISLRWLQLRILEGANADVSLYLVRDFNPESSPALQSPLETLTASTGATDTCSNSLGASQFVERDYANPLLLGIGDGAAAYSWVVYVSGADARVAVTGCARVNLNPS